MMWQRHPGGASLRQEGLTADPGKCAVGRREVRYVGYHFGGGQVRPQVNKNAAIAACPLFLGPRLKKEVRQFLGLARYYRRFIPCRIGLSWWLIVNQLRESCVCVSIKEQHGLCTFTVRKKDVKELTISIKINYSLKTNMAALKR